MSNDGYQHIKKSDKGTYILYYGVASNDHRTEQGEFNNLEDAIKAAQQDYAEYGLSFDFGADTGGNDLQPSDSDTKTKGNSKSPSIDRLAKYKDREEKVIL